MYLCIMKKCIVIFFLPFLFACGEGDNYDVLYKIDSLIVKEKYKLADSVFSTISLHRINTDEDIAHYYLLYTQLSCLLKKPDTLEKLDSIVIPFYTKTDNKDNLAEAYYYKAYKEIVSRNLEKAILYYKKAEDLATKSSNFRLKYKIAESLSYMNQISGNRKLQSDYAHKALLIAKAIQNKEWMAWSYFRIAVANSNLGEKDTSFFYMRKAIPLVKYVNEKDRPIFLTNIALVYKDTHPEIAKQYLHKALSIQEMTITLEVLGDIYNKEGKREDAYKLWKRALIRDNNIPKDNLIHSIMQYDIENGNIDHVCEQIDEIVHIKDSMLNQLKNDTIKDLQLRFDKEIAIHKVDQQLIRWQWSMLAMAIISFILIVFIVVKKYSTKLKYQELELQITEFSAQIIKLEATKANTESQIATLKENRISDEKKITELENAADEANQTIERLNVEINQRMDMFSSRVKEGRLLFDHIMNNGTTSLWTNDQYLNFNEYYERTHTTAFGKLKRGRTKTQLTPHNMFYLILKDIGKNDQEIRNIMGISQEALRTLRFRTKPKE